MHAQNMDSAVMVVGRVRHVELVANFAFWHFACHDCANLATTIPYKGYKGRGVLLLKARHVITQVQLRASHVGW